MVFADSKILLLLWVLPICIFFIFFEMRSIRRRFENFTRFRLDDLLNGVWSYKRAVFKSVLLCLSLLTLIFALARPRWGFEWKEVRRGGTDIVIALDLSTSMLATDIKPNRLERAKREIIDLLKILKGDRIGIVAFAGVAFVYTPLTVDYRLADMFIQQMSLKMMPVQGTVIGDALNQSIDALDKASSNESQGKAIILITDGEDQGKDLLATAKKAKEKGIRVYAIGIGSEAGAPIPLPDGGFKKDHEGNIVVSKLDEHTLQSITTETGGLYVHSTTGNLDLETIYKDIRKIDHDDSTDLTKQKIWHERFQIFIAIALALLLLEFFTRSTRKKRSKDVLKTLALLFLLFLPFSGNRAYANDLSEGQKAFENKDYKTAADKFLKAEIEHPDEPLHAYNRGVSQFYNKQYKEASEAFAKSALSPDPTLAQKSYYNLGNAQVYAGNLQEAIKAYEEALKRNPQDKEAQDNLEWTKKKLEEQEKKKDQDPKNEDKKDQDKDQNKDEKKNDKQDQNKKDDKKDEKEQNNKDKKQEQNQDKQDQSKKDQDPKKDDKQSQSENGDKDKDKKDSGSEQKPEEKKQEQKASEEKNGSEGKELTKEQAEKLLRMIEDQEQVYGMPPKYNKPPSPPDRDW